MRKANIVYTREVGGTTYVEPAWWALDDDGYGIAGPCNDKRSVQMQLAGINRLVKSGWWAARPLYTGY